MEPLKCFLLTPTGRYRKSLRRYHWSTEPNCCPLPHGYHDAGVAIEANLLAESQPTSGDRPQDVSHSDPRWPAACACGYAFVENDDWQVNYCELYERSDTHELIPLRKAPPGAIWDATWWPTKHADGHFYICKLPNGHEWSIDGKASNCTRPNEPHHCWVRHGVAPDLHVDKSGDTCAAGAGSILAGEGAEQWHGFLAKGYLVQ